MIAEMETDPDHPDFQADLEAIAQALGITDPDVAMSLFMDVFMMLEGPPDMPPFDILAGIFSDLGYTLTDDAYLALSEMDMNPESDTFSDDLTELAGILGISDMDVAM